MKYLIILFIGLGFHSLCLAQDIQWMTFEDAVKMNENHPKPFFIDIYTDWCGWCKKMDATTFKEEKVIEYLSDFYCVKLNAEQRDTISFLGKNYVFKPNGSRGFHEFAATLLDGNLSYPSFVVLAPNLSRLDILKGYHEKYQLINRLKSLKW
jgi:uncharacterized protein YyaL (SSP411 family)